jgi:hypothetical protein
MRSSHLRPSIALAHSSYATSMRRAVALRAQLDVPYVDYVAASERNATMQPSSR